MRVLPILAFGLFFPACNPSIDDAGFQNITGQIDVTPDPIAFGDQAVPLATTLEVTISNSARGVALAIDDIRIEGEGASVFSLGELPATVEAQGDATVEITFLPDTYLDFTATLVIDSDDDDDPSFEVPITGSGVAAPLPDISVDRSNVDFGIVPAGNAALTEFVTITNVGTAPLTLGNVAQSGSGAFVLLTDPSRSVVMPQGSVPVLIAYAPPTEEGDTGLLTIPSDDPDEPAVEILLLGNGGADFEFPEAMIDCPGTSAPPEYISLDGLDSFDPEGHTPLIYSWSLTQQPPGSDGTITNLVSPDTSLFTDVAGTYEVQLVVENTIGISSAPARCVIEAIPADDIHVELSWDTPRADLDLHLSSGDASLFERPGDCNWCNKTPAWGAAGTSDDPRLDLDDRGGFGPENINVQYPSDGTYDVRVHYFDDHGDDLVTATVRVYTEGTIAFTDSRILARNEVWDAARVNWPAATAGTLSSVSYEAENRVCFLGN